MVKAIKLGGREMKSIYFEEGFEAATKGGWCAAPTQLKTRSQPWRDWYAGFSAAVKENKHPFLTRKFRARKGISITGQAV